MCFLNAVSQRSNQVIYQCFIVNKRLSCTISYLNLSPGCAASHLGYEFKCRTQYDSSVQLEQFQT